MFVPDQLSLTSFRIGTGSQIVQETIAINIKPLACVVEVAGFRGRYLICLFDLCHIIGSSCYDVDVSFSFTGWQESIWYDY